jgi:hypothetical protein
MRWLTLLVSLPPTPSRHRVGIWRKLKRLGAVNLRGSAWMLPETPETTERFQWLVQEVKAAGGEATLLRVDGIEPMSDAEVSALFHQARGAEYEAVIRGCREILARLDRLGPRPRGPADALRGRLEALKRELDRIRAIDHLDAPLGARARALWETAARRLRQAEARPRPARPGRRRALPPAGSTWVTRPRPHVDRIASAWLIKRFIDDQATFAFADGVDAARKGVPFDVLGAEFGHQGDHCTFETLLERFGVKDRRLRAIAEIVHEADLADGKFARAEASGLDWTLRGLAAVIPDDHELLERGLTVFDGLYQLLKEGRRS